MNFKDVKLDKTIIGEIRKLNLIVIVVGTLVTSLILFVLNDTVPVSIFLLTAKTLIDLTITSFVLFVVLKFSLLKFKNNPLKLILFRYSLSGLLAVLINFFLWYVYSFLEVLSENFYNTKLVLNFIFISILTTRAIIFLHDYVILRQNKIQTELENERLKTKNAEAENLLLKQQIHPHFLFNSLNTLKALYKIDVNKGEKYLIQLANFLRVAVSNNKTTNSIISEELKMCQNYLKMQKMRFGKALEWEIIIEDEDKMIMYSIPSFSLQPLLENAIKHNIISEEAPLQITIEQVNETISVKNNIQRKKYKENSPRTGLNNLAERYLLWSGEEINITTTDTIFCVSLKIQQNENSNH